MFEYSDVKTRLMRERLRAEALEEKVAGQAAVSDELADAIIELAAIIADGSGEEETDNG